MEILLSCLACGGRDEEDDKTTTCLDEKHGYAAVAPLLQDEKHRYCDEEKKKRPFTALVTGNGPFPMWPGHDDYGHYEEDDNTSHLITKHLPSVIKASSEFNSTSTDIRILNPTSGTGASLKTEYAYARTYLERLWEQYGNEIDLIINLGMADGWDHYTVELSEWQEGTVKSVEGTGNPNPQEYYLILDDIGQTIKDVPGPNPWAGIPQQLHVNLGIDPLVLVERAQHAVNSQLKHKATDGKRRTSIEVRPHSDGGPYLCGFIGYESLAQAYVHGYTAKTMFCHVPGWKDDHDLEIGKDVVCALIGQIAASSEKARSTHVV